VGAHVKEDSPQGGKQVTAGLLTGSFDLRSLTTLQACLQCWFSIALGAGTDKQPVTKQHVAARPTFFQIFSASALCMMDVAGKGRCLEGHSIDFSVHFDRVH